MKETLHVGGEKEMNSASSVLLRVVVKQRSMENTQTKGWALNRKLKILNNTLTVIARVAKLMDQTVTQTASHILPIVAFTANIHRWQTFKAASAHKKLTCE